MPSQNIPLWFESYSELKAIEKTQTPKDHFGLCLSVYKQDMTFPYAGVPSPVTELDKEMVLG